MPAAEDWISTKIASPMPRRSYLVASQQVGEVMDVAFFEGPRPAGGLWWIMTNAEFPSGAVSHFAPLNSTANYTPPGYAGPVTEIYAAAESDGAARAEGVRLVGVLS